MIRWQPSRRLRAGFKDFANFGLQLLAMGALAGLLTVFTRLTP